MAKLSMFLPPFAGDYSGAAGVLFGLNSVNVIVDASCCTHNYTGYDEPRWNKRRKTTFGAQLRTLEATLGDDARLLDQTEAAVAAAGAQAVALIGSPVPALVGMDLDGLAWELEDRCGVPAIGIPTTGFDTYELGASMTQELLVKRFAQDGEAGGGLARVVDDKVDPSAPSDAREECLVPATAAGADNGAEAPAVGLEAGHAKRPRRVNILGATVHDFGSASALQAVHDAVLAEAAAAAGAPVEVAWSTAGDYTFDDLARAGSADESVVVGWSGFAAARYLRDRFGVPMRVGVPEAALRALPGVAALLDEPPEVFDAPSSLLIVHDQVIASSVRNALRARGVGVPIAVASLFCMNDEILEEGDFRIADEAALIDYAEDHDWTFIAGDPLLRRLPIAGDSQRWDLPHEAVSSVLFAKGC